ncbi:hypothetical protein Hdeb2414_s0006g00216201 [Helianthus debilis subsp. tardiflorus]
MTQVMYQCLTGKGSITNLILPDLNDLGGLVDQTKKDISRRIESLKKDPMGKHVAVPCVSLPPRAQVIVGDHASSSTNEMMMRGHVMQAWEKRPMVDPNMSCMGGMQKTQWFTDWMNNPSEQNMGLGPGYEMAPFVDNPNMMWPNHYFP